MPKVHRAIFGEVKGAHDLIAASPEAPEAVLTDLASRYTDRLLPTQIPWKPYSCGFPVRGHYVVTRTFPVKATRSGMVQTHAVIVPLDNLGDLPLECLLDLLPVEPQSPVVDPSSVELSEILASIRPESTIPTGYPSLVRMLLNGGVPIWLGQDSFENIVCFLWDKLWSEARREFKFRISAEPNDILDLPATLVCTPIELRPNWKSQQFVDLDLKELLNPSLSECFLLGLPDGEALRSLRERLGLFPAQLPGLKRLEQYVNMVAQDTSDSIRTAVRLMKAMFPETAQCGVEKARLLDSLAQKTTSGTEQDVMALRNLDISAFSDGSSILQAMISGWLTKQTAQGRAGVIFARAILLETHPWKQIADTAMSDVFKSWSANHAQVLWHWWVSDSALIAPSAGLIPKQRDGVEDDLMQSLAANIPSSALPELLNVCLGRGFYLLSSAILLSAPDLSAIDKFRAQLALFVDGLQEMGLPEIANGVSGTDLVDAALFIRDARIISLAGVAVAHNSELLSGIDARDPGWRAVWISALEKGHDLFDGIRQRSVAAHAVFDVLLDDSIVEPILVERLAVSLSSDLIAYRRRSEIWNRLSADIRTKSIATAAQAWLSNLAIEAGRTSIDLEPELEQEAIRLWRSRPALLSPFSLLEFWQLVSSTLTEADFGNWLAQYKPGLTALEAISVGKLIHDNNWDESARAVVRRAKSGRSDLLPVVYQLWNKLDLWDRLYFGFLTNEPVVSEDEWWEAFQQLSIKLYQYGIRQNEIWDEADGDGSRIKQGTGRDEWNEALDLLRKGGAGGTMTVEGLLHQMRNDFYYNSELELLENVYLSKIKRRW